MEQHAVPQDITGFKFKLVGDMTVKQFGELAFGAIAAYIFYASSFYPIFKWPLVAFFAVLGVALAFLPVEERPLDVWIINFFRAIYRPTLYTWKKSVTLSPNFLAQIQAKSTPTPLTVPQIEEAPQPTLAVQPIASTPTPAPAPPPAPEKEPEKPAPPPVQTTPPPTPEPTPQAQPDQGKAPAAPTAPTPPPPANNLSIDELVKMREQKQQEWEKTKSAAKEVPVETIAKPAEPTKETTTMTIEQLTKMRDQMVAEQQKQSSSSLSIKESQMADLQAKQKEVMTQIDHLKYPPTPTAPEKVADEEKELATLTEQKNNLAAQITALRQEIINERVAPLSNPAYQQTAEENKAPSVRVVAKPAERPAMVTLTELPNVVNGIVFDSANVPLDAVILIIKDKSGNSIRALRTNKVGQFIVSTPLENGVYYLEFEKKDYQFDTLEVTLTGQILEPLRITAKP